jgi:hypothetical protein
MSLIITPDEINAMCQRVAIALAGAFPANDWSVLPFHPMHEAFGSVYMDYTQIGLDVHTYTNPAQIQRKMEAGELSMGAAVAGQPLWVISKPMKLNDQSLADFERTSLPGLLSAFELALEGTKTRFPLADDDPSRSQIHVPTPILD